MNVLLVQIDGKWPNVALMKISSLYKSFGSQVDLCIVRKQSLGFLGVKPHVAFISCIFSKNYSIALKVSKLLEHKGITTLVGGPGCSEPSKLPIKIEHQMPDYGLYGIDYSMGYTSRGCFRNCPWCLVPKLEGALRDHAPISEFHHPKHNKIILLDNNFLASPKWKENLFYIIEHGLTVNFSQGLDIRLINDYNANLLAHTRYANWTFRNQQLHFAFDDIKIEKAVREGVETLKAHGIRPRELAFYMLCGYLEPYSFEDDMYRFQVLREIGVDPFVMRYNNRKDIPLLNHFSRYVNKRIYKKVKDFNEYKPAKKVFVIEAKAP